MHFFWKTLKGIGILKYHCPTFDSLCFEMIDSGISSSFRRGWGSPQFSEWPRICTYCEGCCIFLRGVIWVWSVGCSREDPSIKTVNAQAVCLQLLQLRASLYEAVGQLTLNNKIYKQCFLKAEEHFYLMYSLGRKEKYKETTILFMKFPFNHLKQLSLLFIFRARTSHTVSSLRQMHWFAVLSTLSCFLST